MAFNRERMNLGINKSDSCFEFGKDTEGLNIYTSYSNLDEKTLKSLIDSEDLVTRDSNGKIIRIYFYDDKSNPIYSKPNSLLWNRYFEKLQRLSTLKRKH